MKQHNEHKNRLPEPFDSLESRLVPPSGPPKEEVWRQMEKRLDETVRSAPLKRSIFLRSKLMAVAAALLVLFAIGAVVRFYSVSYVTPQGKQIAVTLPDQSVVILNADSKLTYKPLWWGVARELNLSGEAFFSVTKGKKFTVHSKNGTTTVLGTRFNIFARNDVYKVACVSGKVKVAAAHSKNSIVLNPSEMAEITPDGKIIYRKNIDLKPVTAWKQHLFSFTSAPLGEVVRELERRYNVIIRLKTDENARYTGSFPDTVDINTALKFVCKPFGLNFARDDNGVIMIYK